MYSHTAELPVIAGARRARRSITSAVSPLSAALLLLSAFFGVMAWRAAAPSTRIVADASPALVVSLHDRPSHGGRYRAEVTSVSSLGLGATQQWIVRLARPDHRRVKGAHIAAHAWMPDDPTQVDVPATVTPIGGGRYRLDDIRFTRPGWWNVALVVDGPRGIDSLAFNVVLR